MRYPIPAVLCVILSVFSNLPASRAAGCACERSAVIGRVEKVVMQDVGIKLTARIDTGAGMSSIDAKIIEIKPATEGAAETAVFEIKDDEGKAKSMQRRIVKWAEIKGKGTKKLARRPVVIVDFCLGGKRLEGRINLTDRSRFLYPVLIGRNILRTGDFLIDPRKKFMTKPGC